MTMSDAGAVSTDPKQQAGSVAVDEAPLETMPAEELGEGTTEGTDEGGGEGEGNDLGGEASATDDAPAATGATGAMPAADPTAAFLPQIEQMLEKRLRAQTPQAPVDDSLGDPTLKALTQTYWAADADIAKIMAYKETEEFAELPQVKQDDIRDQLRDLKQEKRESHQRFHYIKQQIVASQTQSRDIAATQETVAAYPHLKGREQEIQAFIRQHANAIYSLPNAQVAMAAVVAGIGAGAKGKTTTAAPAKRAPVKPLNGGVGAGSSANGAVIAKQASAIPSEAKQWAERVTGYKDWGKNPEVEKQLVKDHAAWKRRANA